MKTEYLIAGIGALGLGFLALQSIRAREIKAIPKTNIKELSSKNTSVTNLSKIKAKENEISKEKATSLKSGGNGYVYFHRDSSGRTWTTNNPLSCPGTIYAYAPVTNLNDKHYIRRGSTASQIARQTRTTRNRPILSNKSTKYYKEDDKYWYYKSEKGNILRIDKETRAGKWIMKLDYKPSQSTGCGAEALRNLRGA